MECPGHIAAQILTSVDAVLECPGHVAGGVHLEVPARELEAVVAAGVRRARAQLLQPARVLEVLQVRQRRLRWRESKAFID